MIYPKLILFFSIFLILEFDFLSASKRQNAESSSGGRRLIRSKSEPPLKQSSKNKTPAVILDPKREMLYRQMHKTQTYKFVEGERNKWLTFKNYTGTIMDALYKVGGMGENKDKPPNEDFLHMIQVAERIRHKYDKPEFDWFHLVGLIHDLGKMLQSYGVPEYAVIGGTYPVGCAWHEKITLGVESFKGNPDNKHPVYSTKFGVYSEGIGFDKLRMTWGHDEYMYQVLRNHKVKNNIKFPDEAMYIIRFHSFHAWRLYNAYDYLANTKDGKLQPWLIRFNKMDFSKKDEVVDWKPVMEYYQKLVDKYIPGELNW